MRFDKFHSFSDSGNTSEIGSLKRIHLILSSINQSIVRIRDKQTLLDEVCKIIIENGGYDFAWIEMKHENTNQFSLAASYIKMEFYDLNSIEISKILADENEINSIKENGYLIQQNLFNKTINTTLFGNRIISQTSSLSSFPIIVDKELTGMLKLLTNQQKIVNENEIDLFTEVAGDIAYAIERINLEEKTVRNENKLREIIESSTNLFYSHDTNFQLTYVSPKSWEYFGCDPSEAAVNWTNFLTDNPINQIGIKHTIDAIKTGLKQEPYELELKRKDGTPVWVLVNETPVVKNGKTVSIVGSLSNITERKNILIERDNFYKYSNDVMCTVDIDGNFIDSNDAWEKLLGYTKEELKSNNVKDLVHPDDIASLLKVKKEANIGKASNFLLRIRCKDQSIKWLSWNCFIIKNKFYGLGKDVTDLIEVENKLKATIQKLENTNKELHRLSRAVEQSPISIVLTDLKGNIEYANPKCLEITGFTWEEIIRKNPRIFKSGEKNELEYKELWETISSGNEWRGEFHNKKKNGELYWELASISPVKNKEGKIISYLAVKEDITERKKMIDELIDAKEKAEEINRIKSSFFSNMSHELRTPLVGIIGFSDMLLDEIGNKDQREFVQSILDSGNRLLKTLNTILNISKLEGEKTKLNIETNNLYSEVAYVVNSNNESAVNKNLELVLNCSNKDLYGEIDKKIFRIAVTNLITNAIKFTDKGSITVNINSKIKDKTEYAVIDICDTGIGISSENCQIIFEEFRQGSEGLSRNFEGVGLGLTIAKKYVHLLKGDIRVESELGKGSKFTIEIPLIKYNPQINLIKNNLSDEIQSTQKNNNRRILLVEDDSINRSVTKYFLKDICALDTVKTGEAALDIIKTVHYDAILMDIALGAGMNGLETTHLIRQEEEYKNTPIIALTAYAMHIEKDKFLLEGCNEYLSKPFSKNDLVEKVLNAFANKKDNIPASIN